MAGVIVNYSKSEIRAIARLLRAGEVSQSEIDRRLVRVYSKNVFSGKEVSVWCSKFRDGRTALSDDPEKQRGRPRTSHTDEC
jgi:hypothetical protein